MSEINRSKKTARQSEQGSALVYILIAIALLAALTMAFMNPSSNQTTSQNTFKTVSELQSQVDFIRAAVQECVLVYSGGDDGLDKGNFCGTAGPTCPNAADLTNIPYPIMPDSDYLDNCPAPDDSEDAGTWDVRLIRCPGNPGDDPCHADLFGGMSGKFLPPPPSLFGEWKWYNGADGIFFWIETTATDAFITTVMEKLNGSYGACEADIINGGNADLTSDMTGTVICPNGSSCFRVWMRSTATAVYPTESATCP